MKIVSWNCNGAFRKKYSILFEKIPADIYVIQECENPEKISNNKDKEFLTSFNYRWIGENKNKGLAVFSKISIDFEEQNSYYLRYFIPFKVNTKRCYAIWAMNPYIEEMVVYFSIYKHLLNEKSIIIGDFNSNVIWDTKHNIRNHTTFNTMLKKVNLESAFHVLNKIAYGKENTPTLYMYRNLEKGYYIDYAYSSPKYMKTFIIGSPDEWLTYSDHMPILLETISR